MRERVRACVRERVRACECACVRACVRARVRAGGCVRACVCVCVSEIGEKTINPCLYVTYTDFDRHFLFSFLLLLAFMMAVSVASARGLPICFQ